MENMCYCCSVCIESGNHWCHKNTPKIKDVENVNYFDENIYEIYAQFCCHNQGSSNEKIEEIFKGWYIHNTCYGGRSKISNIPYMLQKGCYTLYSFAHIEKIACNTQWWLRIDFKYLVDNIKIGSLIKLYYGIASLPDLSKLISDRSWQLKKIGIDDKNYVVVQEELVTKVALK